MRQPSPFLGTIITQVIENLISGQIDPRTGEENRTQFDYGAWRLSACAKLEREALGRAARMARAARSGARRSRVRDQPAFAADCAGAGSIKLRRRTPKGGRRSLRAIALELEKAGFVSHTGKRYAATAIARMLREL